MAASETGKKQLSVLFICTGNTCRSPLAEAAFRESLRAAEMEHLVRVSSAGLMAREGATASSQAVQVGSDLGFDLSSHRSRQLTEEMFTSADIVIGMQRTHLIPLEQLKQASGRELILLGRFHESSETGQDVGIADPFGGGRPEYERAFAAILGSMDGLLEYIRGILDKERK